MSDAPKLVIHTLCGEPVFYYFGSKEDAQQLKNFDDITTLAGDAIVPDDIKSCVNCGEKISISQIQVAVHEQTIVNRIITDDPDLDDETKDAVEKALKRLDNEVSRKIQDEKTKRGITPPENTFFWETPSEDDPDDDDTQRIHPDEPKGG